MGRLSCSAVIVFLCGGINGGPWWCEGLSSLPPPSSLRRDWFLKAPIGAVLTYSYGNALYNAFQNLGLKHPEEHERRVRSTIEATLNAAVRSTNRDTMRILEVGIGSDCRILRRGLYQDAFKSVAKQGKTKVDLVGVDLKPPDEETLEVTRQALSAYNSGVDVNLQVVEHSITTPLPFPAEYFDAIVCCLTLCSVDDPVQAVKEMRRLLRSKGGALGYVEHVAASEYAFLEKQQRVLDLFQQKVADNCHLHRYTEQTLQENLPGFSLIQEERFLVNAMWPVSMQSCGIFQTKEHVAAMENLLMVGVLFASWITVMRKRHAWNPGVPPNVQSLQSLPLGTWGSVGSRRRQTDLVLFSGGNPNDDNSDNDMVSIGNRLIQQACKAVAPNIPISIQWKPGHIIVTLHGGDDGDNDIYLSSPLPQDDEEGGSDPDETHDNQLENGSNASTTPVTAGVDVATVARVINAALGDDTSGVGPMIAQTHSIEVTTPGVSPEKDGLQGDRMFAAYAGFDVLCEYEDPKKNKKRTIEGRLLERTDTHVILNCKGRITKLVREHVLSVKLPKAKREK